MGWHAWTVPAVAAMVGSTTLLGPALPVVHPSAPDAPVRRPAAVQPAQPVAPGGAARPSAAPENTAAPAPPDVPRLAVDRVRKHVRIASGGVRAPYNYAPTVLATGDGYRMWWCSQLPGARPAGDDVLHARARSLAGPFHAADGRAAEPVFSGSRGRFDGVHTCDPSVLKVGGDYYLYYTGAAHDREHANSIGVAHSVDGRQWRRLQAGPIVRPSRERLRENVYGAGQPAALYLDGWFYLMFTDTSGGAAGDNGAGQFVLRATDPVFTRNVQSLTNNGFRDVGSTAGARERSIVEAFSADWMWVPELDAFAVAHETVSGTTITFWDRDFTEHPYQPVLLRGVWQEGPGLVRTEQGHAPPSPPGGCRVPVDVVRATRTPAAPTGLAHFGADVRPC